MADILLKAENVTLKRANKVILDDISLEIKEKDFITIVGPNGAGKSMLLKTLIGIFKPTKGNISRKDKLKIGYVPQRLSVDMTIPMTVEYFLSLNKKIACCYYDILVSDLGLEKLFDTQLHVLSGGEMQRVLLARALLDEPDILILDEPAQNLDVMGQTFFYKYIEKFYALHDIAIIMVSHDLHLVMSCTKNVICLYGHICCTGSPEKVSQDPNFIKIFGSDLSKMISFYHHHHDHSHDNGEDCCDH